MVENTSVIWLNSETGRKQPSISMVSKAIRGEALLLYYSENSFGFDVTSKLKDEKEEVPHKNVPDRVSHAILNVQKWASAFEETGLLVHLRQFFIRCSSLANPDSATAIIADREINNETVVVALIKSDGDLWQAPEVHRNERCVMSSYARCGMCVIKVSPEWLNSAVVKLSEHSRDGICPARSIAELAKLTSGRAEELMDLACVD